MPSMSWWMKRDCRRRPARGDHGCARNPPGRPARVRRIARSASASTKASCCDALIHSTAAWGSSSRTKSQRHWGWSSISACPRQSPTPGLAPLQMPGLVKSIARLPLPMVLAAFKPPCVLYRSLMANPGTLVPLDAETIYPRDLEIPSGGGVGTDHRDCPRVQRVCHRRPRTGAARRDTAHARGPTMAQQPRLVVVNPSRWAVGPPHS